MNSPLPESPAAAAAATTTTTTTNGSHQQLGCTRYESQKRRDWNTFGQFLRSHYKPAVSPSECGGAHVLEFLRYLDQFGKTKVHCPGCPFFGLPCPPSPCPCPLRQAWGSLDSLVGRLRAALNEHVNSSESDDTNTNPFAAPAVRLYLREVRDEQSKARGVSYCKKKRKHRPSDMSPDATNSPVELRPLPPPSSPALIHRYN